MTDFPLPSWPDGADVCVCLTFDFDTDIGLKARGAERLMSTRSEDRFASARGMSRILSILAATGVSSTVYVPGETAERYPAAVREVVDAGHEIGHHGHAHLMDPEDEADQRDELVRGLAALEDVVGVRPQGFRSPGWELRPETLGMLVAEGFAYDSSCMGDDRPYHESWGDVSILELPVHWSLDDFMYYSYRRQVGSGTMSHPAAMSAAFLGEFDSAVEDARVVTYTMHPSITGRGYRARELRALIDEMRSRANVWFATHSQLVNHLRRTGVVAAR
ncbi:MAG: peptidoglycan-N-acetylglucosamine deacetylase [Solirubrobacteraceae bacterium]